MKWFSRVLVFVALASTCIADSVVYMRVPRPLIEEQLKLSPADEANRIRTLRGLFQRGGCLQVVEQQVPNQDFPNLMCILPGDEEGTIVVGASSDYPSNDARTPGGWGALTALPLLAESLGLVPHRFTLMLIAFSGNQHGMRGASWYVSQLTAVQRKNIRAMINLDNLGEAPPVFALAQPDNTLGTWLQVAAASLRLPAPGQVNADTLNLPLQNLLTVKDEDLWADAKPFRQIQVPSIAVESATSAMPLAMQQNGAMPERDIGTAFDMQTYEDTYRLMCAYVLYLDSNLGRPLVEPGIYSGKIVDTAGIFTTSPVDVSVKIGRFNTMGELNRYELILEKGGQEGLADVLADENEKGYFRFGLNLAFAVKIVALQNSGKTPYILLVAPRIKQKASTARDYRFTVIKLTLDGKGSGDGLYYNTAKLRFNKQHELTIEDFGSKPDDVTHVRLDQPALPRTSPVTAVVAAVKTQSGASPAASAPPAASKPLKVPTNTVSVSVPQNADAVNVPATPPNGNVNATFHAKAQLVQVDVAVTDAQGKPVRDLKESDFTVLEDGKPQDIRAFDAHVPIANQATAPAPSVPVLPPHVFTNRVVVPVEDTLSILMLDLLNTPLADQAYARKQTIEFLKTLPPGKRIAMFALSRKLVMVQGFSDDSATLVAAAEKVLNERSFLLTTEADRQQFQGFMEEIASNASTAVTAPNAPAGALSNASGNQFGFGQERERSNAMTEGDRTAVRVDFTLDALTALSRAVSGYPGRKNLIWLSGSFPVRLRPTGIDFYKLGSAQSSESTGLVDTPDFRAAIRAATTALATARIAVFPMDVRGLQSGGVDITVGAAESASFSGTDSPEAYKQNLNTQSETRFQERSSMKEVAEQTGGEVLPGNDVRHAIAKAIDDGSTYYTLAYTPHGDDSGQQFRKIDVKLNRGGLKLFYRPGYYPDTSHDSPPPGVHPLIVAMQPGTPPSTVIPLTVEVLPPDGTSKKIRINYTIDIGGINFADIAEHRKHAVIDCIAVAFTEEGVPAGQISNTIDATLPLADYESAQRTGLVVKQELELPPGKYNLRMGVMDRGSQKIGTLVVPLNLAAVSITK